MSEDPDVHNIEKPEPRAERKLDRMLSLYEVPEPPPGFERRFWQRFHKARMLGEEGLNDGHARKILRVLGPVAACLVIAFGLWVLVKPETSPQTPDPSPIDKIADENTEPDPLKLAAPAATPEDADPYMEVLAPQVKEIRPRRLDLAKLRLLKELDRAEFADLNIGNPEDMPLIDDLAMLRELDRVEAEND